MPVNARRHIRRMRGGAQAHLLEADDGKHYVVKFQNNPQHRRVLINECVASMVLRYLQISTPETAIVSITREFLAENPEVSFQLGAAQAPVTPGWHFGSRYPDDPARIAVYDFLPDVLLPQVVNLSHFLGVLVVDKWMANADGRQSIYFRARVGGLVSSSGARSRRLGFVAQMIDQGFVFNGPHWEFHDSPLQGLALRLPVYHSVRSMDDFQPWLDQVLHLPEEVLDKAVKQIPPEWLDADEEALESVLERLLMRRGKVADLIQDCQRTRAQVFPNWKSR